uniref:Uncharacterized protein n=1 Tax=Globisporangium ultimum (strain ATCC 200006 / CBS 805.95 / DAOM BR144) TaxID=431595 RepID=K3WS20_GLOUD
MLRGGHPHDKCVVTQKPDGVSAARGKPAKAPIIPHQLYGLNKSVKQSRVPVRASPMPLSMLQKVLHCLRDNDTFPELVQILSFQPITE